jgi:hypothetical protein
LPIGTPWFGYGYHKYRFGDILNKHIGLPDCVHYWVYSSH